MTDPADPGDRLRTGLAALAEQVPVTEDPIIEQRRRQSAGAPRRRWPAPAVAAAVVVGVLVPTAVVLRDPFTAPPAPAATGGPSTPARPTASPADPIPSDPVPSDAVPVVGGPMRLGTFTDLGRSWTGWLYLQPRAQEPGGWSKRVCAVAVPTGQPYDAPTRHPASAGCVDGPTRLPGQPALKVQTRAALPAVPNVALLLFVAVPQVTRLEARGATGEAVAVQELLRTDDYTIFVGNFGASFEGFGYTAYDATGAVVENAIT